MWKLRGQDEDKVNRKEPKAKQKPTWKDLEALLLPKQRIKVKYLDLSHAEC